MSLPGVNLKCDWPIPAEAYSRQNLYGHADITPLVRTYSFVSLGLNSGDFDGRIRVLGLRANGYSDFTTAAADETYDNPTECKLRRNTISGRYVSEMPISSRRILAFYWAYPDGKVPIL